MPDTESRAPETTAGPGTTRREARGHARKHVGHRKTVVSHLHDTTITGDFVQTISRIVSIAVPRFVLDIN